VIAHVGGVPVEEVLLAVLTGATGGLLLVRTWLAARLRREPVATTEREMRRVSSSGA
jgi:hypothetical protein